MMYDIFDKVDRTYLKTACTMEAIIQEGHTLTDDEVRKYFKIDEDHRYWDHSHKPSRVKRYVFDKLIVPDNSRYEFQPCYEEEDV